MYFNMATRERRAAILEDEKVVELLIERSVENRIVGNVYKGRVVNVLPGMQAAFVDIGRDKNAFLYRDDLLSFQKLPLSDEVKKKKNISELVKKGEELLVQVTKEGFGTKGPRLSGVVSFPGKYIVYMPNGNYIGVSRKIRSEAERTRLQLLGEELTINEEGLIIRTVCEGASREEIEEDIRILRGFWEETWKEKREAKPPALIHQDTGLIERIFRDFSLDHVEEIFIDNFSDYKRIVDLLGPQRKEKLNFYQGKENIFSEYGIDKELDKALRRQVWLKNGAYLMIDQTEALTVIDVNTGKFIGKNDLQDTIKRTNIEASREIARQLRLRDISGIIIIDFIDMKAEQDRIDVLNYFKNALEKDRTKTNVLGLTGLGLVEMTRKKIRQNLQDSLSKVCPTCKGKGSVLSNEAQAFHVERLLWEYRGMDHEALVLELPPHVSEVLRGKKDEHLKRLEEALHFKIFIFENRDMIEQQYGIPFMGSQLEAQKKLERLMKEH
ncbi:Rne/Rng family ribonuclease [Alkalihalobacterium elongatum]|uniref:Rne/Rng family ribonuclease n=1 Tax=Alkalihalobacterium elongatum TaxID=2675466 RepID=UPI001F18D919|nr:Rne/Rng family ribonuclease [Alkalihalobacterium elongatum]